MSKEIRAYVLDRNGCTCQMCGAAAGEPHPFDPSKKARLQIGHIIDKSQGGSDDPSYLRWLMRTYPGQADAMLNHPAPDER